MLRRGDQKYPIELAAVAAPKVETDKIPPAENRMGFFVTSKGPGKGGHLGGLAGADRHCQALAEAAGAGDRTWRAYLSTSYQDKPAINAGDRIGTGPWYNAKGIMIARGVADLHKGNRISKEMALTEKGEMVGGFGDEPNHHDILTGTQPDGTAAVGMNCNNWASSNEGTAMAGHHDRKGTGENASSWNSSHTTRSCSQEDFRATGGDGLFYCFAIK
ncbi:MAG: lectin [Acidobacteria bacterium]|nr:lectin [Acidobacteriota bacterium]